MLRSLLLLFTAIPLLASQFSTSNQISLVPSTEPSATRIEMSFPLPGLELIDGQEVIRFSGEGMLGQAGAPDLPLVSRLVEIPATRDLRLEVIDEQWVSLGVHAVRPLQERLHSELDLPLAWAEDEAIYSSNTFWPEDWAQVSEPVLVRQTRLVKLSIAPMRWNPVTGELLALSSLNLEVRFHGRNETNSPMASVDDESLSDEDEGLVYSHERRRAEAAFTGSLLGDRVIRLYQPESNPDDHGSLESIDWDAPGLPLNYLVFAKAAAQSQLPFQNWLNWKRRKGHHVTVVSESDVSFTTTGIRNEIIAQYQNSDFPPHYVALVGDVEGTYSIPTHSSQYDHYYATIAGNDILADVVVGRISVETATELATVLNKVVYYESTPLNVSTSWMQRASFLTGTGHCGESMSQLSRSIGFQLMEEKGYTQIDTAFCANSPSYVYNWMNQGISFYNYRGWIGMEGLSQTTLMGMTNPYTPIAVVFTCSSGDFYSTWETAYTEAFLRGGNATQLGGAAAAMGFCTPQTHTAYNNVVCGGFWSGMLNYGIPQVGTCMFRGKYDLYLTLPIGDGNTNNFSYWANLMGDPGMDMTCGIPQSMEVMGLPTSIGTGVQSLSLQLVSGLTPVAGAAVCAWFDESRSVVAVSDDAGHVHLELPAMEAGALHLTATKGFHYPVMEQVMVDDALAMPVLGEISLTDEGEDGLWQPGENASLVLEITNESESAALDMLEIELVALDAGVTLTGTTATTDAITPGGSAQTVGDLSLTVPGTWTEGQPVRLLVLIDDGERQVGQRLDLIVDTPVISIATGSGSLSSPLNPGGTSTMSLRLDNSGNLPANGLVLNFSVPDENFILSPESQTVDALEPGSQQTLSIDITALTGTVAGYTTQLLIDWTVDEAWSGQLRQAFTLGDNQPEDPTGPDAYGYYAFESSDSQYLQAPVYNWVEIAPNGMGPGTAINLHDNGDEQDDSRRVDLPFPFSVYGQVYTSMAVCSNGYVAFGELAHLETDFRNHYMPCGMGPEPMLAPMWDDFYLTSDAQVATYHDEESGTFTVEWYRMRTNSNNRVNTFQLILYDPSIYVTPTGDGEFVFQYHTFDDTQSNSQDFPYCTVGIKDQTATMGLNLKNYNSEHVTVDDIDDGVAIRFTTSIGLSTDPAQLELPVSEVAFALMQSETQVYLDSLEIRNVGEAPLIWQATVLQPRSLPLMSDSRDGGGPDGNGYTWRDSNEADGPAVGWVDAGDTAQWVVFEENDDNEGPFEIGFDFPFYGDVYNQFWVNSNGFIAFEDPVDGYYQNNVGGLPDNDAPDLALFPWWDDLLTSETLEGITNYWSNGTDSLVVSWIEAPHFNQVTYGGPFTFQVVLEAGGRVTFNYGDMNASDPDSDSGTIGWQIDQNQGTGILNVQDQAIDNYSIWILPPFWLELSTASGVVPTGGSGYLRYEATNNIQGFQLPEGEYSAGIRFVCNDPDQAQLEIPVAMTVNDLAVEGAELPATFAVGEAWPNPFNPTTTIEFSLPQAELVSAVLFNIRGQQVRSLLRDTMPAGSHRLVLDASDLSSGVYLLRVIAGQDQAVRKVMLVK